MLKTDFSALALRIFSAIVCAMAVCSCGSAVAITIDTVLVGDAGNPNDPADGDGNVSGVQNFGAVSYEYRIGKYEVTVRQFTSFLNAVAATDTYGLYDRINPNKIARSGTS